VLTVVCERLFLHFTTDRNGSDCGERVECGQETPCTERSDALLVFWFHGCSRSGTGRLLSHLVTRAATEYRHGDARKMAVETSETRTIWESASAPTVLITTRPDKPRSIKWDHFPFNERNRRQPEYYETLRGVMRRAHDPPEPTHKAT
jgi:hypothetical protein